MVYWWCGETASEKKSAKTIRRKTWRNSSKCPNLDPEDAENLRKEDESSKREERKKVNTGGNTRHEARIQTYRVDHGCGYCMRVGFDVLASQRVVYEFIQ
jgi:hypothetical protein